MNNKKGISLVVLTLTIIIMVLLASTVIFYVNDTMVNSKMSAFALDLKNVEDLVYEYYLNNNEFPVDPDITYDKTELLALVTNGKDNLSKEIEDNNDNSETFYVIELNKLSVESTNRGMQANGGTIDSYIVTKDSMNVYYLKGEKIRNKYYFSLTKDVVQKTELDVDITLDDSTINITNVTSSIDYKKSTKEWTNVLTVEVKSEVATGETLAYKLAGKDITESVKEKKVDVSEILKANEEIRNAFYESDASKILKVQKIKAEKVIAETDIDVSNLDILSGNTITQSNVKHTEYYKKYVLANISGYEDLGGSGLKEVRVLYTTKLDSDGNTVAYYENLPDTITKEYIYSLGARNEGLLIKLPLDVTRYEFVFVDNAGNISDINVVDVIY